jgi:hypothetical protein
LALAVKQDIPHPAGQAPDAIRLKYIITLYYHQEVNC